MGMCSRYQTLPKSLVTYYVVQRRQRVPRNDKERHRESPHNNSGEGAGGPKKVSGVKGEELGMAVLAAASRWPPALSPIHPHAW